MTISDDKTPIAPRRNPAISRAFPVDERTNEPTVGPGSQEADSGTCVCDKPGWCVRHQCEKSEHWHMLCQTRPDYFQLWEEGRGPGQCFPTSEMEPSLVQKALSLGAAVVRHAADGAFKLDDAAYFARLDICRSCGSCDAIRMVCRDPSCGCQLYIKARWRSEKCPQGKWPQATSDSA